MNTTTPNKDNEQAQQIKNIVIVHGAFGDGSGWRAVYDILSKKGFDVTIVQNPLSSLEDDVAATQVVLDKQNGPVVLVGHSWGGTVITEAGNDTKVKSLVYVSALQPDNGETSLQLLQTEPPAPEDGILPPDSNGILYYDRAKFHGGFCADLSQDEANFMAASQGAFYLKCLTTPAGHPAWRDKPVFACIPQQDKCIVPPIQHMMCKRSGAKVTEIPGCHVIFMSQPEAVASVIEDATKVMMK
jgi:pimeloyl-ACP methyl ester carboxylesterase